MLSRVANSLYWLGRYVERAENYARFIEVNFNLSLDLPPEMAEQWEPLITATGDLEEFNKRYDTCDRNTAIFFLAFDEGNPNSIFSSISKARENARIVRENLTKETWEKLNEVYLIMKDGRKKEIWKMENPSDFVRSIKYGIQLLYGIADNSVARTEGWHWVNLGQFLERADKTSRVLDVKYHYILPSPDDIGSPLDDLHWVALLKSVSGFNTYRRFYGNISPSGLVDFLVLDTKFPRSIYYCLTEAENCLKHISGSHQKGFANKAEKVMGELRSQLEYDDISDVVQHGLHEYLDNLQFKLNNISDEIFDHFFRIKNNLVQEQSLQE